MGTEDGTESEDLLLDGRKFLRTLVRLTEEEATREGRREGE